MKVKHAVIMCIYNGDKAIDMKAAIDSLLKQSVANHIYIYVDGKINSSLEDVLGFISTNQQIIVYRNEINRGLAFGLNFLIDEILLREYEFISRMDSDDISLANRLECQELFLNEHQGIDVVGTFCTEFGGEYALDIKKLPLHHFELVKFSALRCPFIHPTVMFRTAVFNSGYRYPTNTFYSEDLALWFELISNGVILANIPQVLLKYRITDSTLGRRKGLRKAINETVLRFSYMKKMKLISFKNIILLAGKFFFHLMPIAVTKIIYRLFR